MSKPDDGTSEFKVASLRDLLEGEETGKPAKGSGGGGGDRTRQLAIIGGAAAGVVALILVVMLVAGGGDGGGAPTDEDLFPASFEIRSTKVARVERGDRISVCSPSAGPLAQDIEVTDKSVDETAIGGFATVSVEATEEQAALLSSVPDDTEVYEKDRCVRFTSTAPSTPATVEPTPETGPS